MAIKFTFDQNNNYLKVSFEGKMGMEELKDYFGRLKLLHLKPGLRILADIRKADLADVYFKDIQQLHTMCDEAVEKAVPVKKAVLVNEKVKYGIARMYQMLAERDGFDVEVFEDEKGCERWLGSGSGISR